MNPSLRPSRSGATLWPVAVGLFYGTFAAGMIGFAIWSGGHGEELVAKDYYARTVTHQAHMESAARGRAIEVSLEPSADATGLRLQTPPGLAAVATEVRIELYRPSRAALDVKLDTAFDPTGQGTVALATPLASGLWRATVFWKLDHQDYLREFSFHIP